MNNDNDKSDDNGTDDGMGVGNITMSTIKTQPAKDAYELVPEDKRGLSRHFQGMEQWKAAHRRLSLAISDLRKQAAYGKQC